MQQRELVEQARGGDHDAFASLARGSIARLDAAARIILRDPDRAKDAVQDALVRCWRDLPSLRDPDRFDAWLHRLLVNACLDEVRRFRRRRVEISLSSIDGPEVTDSATVTIERDQLERGLLALEPEQRAVIVLHHYLGMPMPDTAVALGIPLGTAKSRLHRALATLRSSLLADDRAAEPSKGHVA